MRNKLRLNPSKDSINLLLYSAAYRLVRYVTYL